jgi:hypothetical protein
VRLGCQPGKFGESRAAEARLQEAKKDRDDFT